MCLTSKRLGLWRDTIRLHIDLNFSHLDKEQFISKSQNLTIDYILPLMSVANDIFFVMLSDAIIQ